MGATGIGVIDRRSLLKTALAALALGATRAQAAPAGPDLLLNRLTFGATPTLRDDLARLGPAAWLDLQLALPATDPGLSARLAAARLQIAYPAGTDGPGRTWPARDEHRPLTSLQADPQSLLPLIDWEAAMDYAERTRPAEEVIAASLIRAVHAPAQLREVMTQFWHDHFNVHAQKSEMVSIYFPAYDAGLRQHAFGNFRQMLGFVARSPAMLAYLNNDESRASPANENFARELLELHTLGAANYLNDSIADWHDVPGAAQGLALGYLDDDVYEVARAFTGWTLGDGRWVAEGANTPKTGRFEYVEGWHDPYQKRVLGREFPSHRAPMADGDEVLDMLATHPGTARFVCEKIARRLLADTPPPDLVARLAQVFLARAGDADQIAQVIRALVAAPEFASPATKMRRPFEWLAAVLRASGAEVAATTNDWAFQLTRAGWRQHTYPAPTGHPDRARDWHNSTVVLRMIENALYAQDDWFGLVRDRLSDRLPAGLSTMADLAGHWSDLLHGPATAQPPVLSGLDPAWDLPTDPVELHDLSAIFITAAALSPQFMFR